MESPTEEKILDINQDKVETNPPKGIIKNFENKYIWCCRNYHEMTEYSLLYRH